MPGANAYNLNGPTVDEAYNLEERGPGWVAFYSEKGQAAGLQLSGSEKRACAHLAELPWRHPTTQRRE